MEQENAICINLMEAGLFPESRAIDRISSFLQGLESSLSRNEQSVRFLGSVYNNRSRLRPPVERPG